MDDDKTVTRGRVIYYYSDLKGEIVRCNKAFVLIFEVYKKTGVNSEFVLDVFLANYDC